MAGCGRNHVPCYTFPHRPVFFISRHIVHRQPFTPIPMPTPSCLLSFASQVMSFVYPRAQTRIAKHLFPIYICIQKNPPSPYLVCCGVYPPDADDQDSNAKQGLTRSQGEKQLACPVTRVTDQARIVNK